MASPVADSYVGPSGGIVAGGRYRLPDWAPAVGTIADISLNTMSAVRGSDPDPSHQYNYWAGVAYAKKYGAKGSLIFNSGGHSGTLINYVYRYDIATRLHSMERQPIRAPAPGHGARRRSPARSASRRKPLLPSRA